MLDAGGYRIEFEHLPGAPHYRMVRHGSQRQLWINTAHKFFTHVYSGIDATPNVRTALELLLLAQGDCELDALQSKRQRFYASERTAWSLTLETYLNILDDNAPQADAEVAEIAMTEHE